MFRPRLIILQPTPYCNIDCSYCYLGHRNDRRLMSHAVVEAVRDKILARLPPGCVPNIVWHAGEPTTAPIGWYEHAYACLTSACPAGTQFALQSNGIAIDASWIDLFRRTETNVSLSIDGPQRFHDERRRTRNGKPTWHLALRGLRRLQDAGFRPSVITVLHPRGLDCADEYYRFYRDHGIADVSFSIDEFEGANGRCSFSELDHKSRITAFLLDLLERAYDDGYPLHIRDVERVAHILAGTPVTGSELVEPWASIVVAADGSVSTFSPEFMEAQAPRYDNFVFGNILDGDLNTFSQTELFQRVTREVAAGVTACRSECCYFAVCGGGSPVNKFCEKGDLACTETQFCRLSTQTSADALTAFLARRRPAPQPRASAPSGLPVRDLTLSG
jgi:uncharacterized protein